MINRRQQKARHKSPVKQESQFNQVLLSVVIVVVAVVDVVLIESMLRVVDGIN